MSLNDLTFSLDDVLTLPPIPTPSIKCTPAPDAYAENPFAGDSPLPFAASKLHLLPLVSSRILCEGDDVKTTGEIVIDVRQCDSAFLPGDTIGIWPENSAEEVDSLLNRVKDSFVADGDPSTDRVLNLTCFEGSKKKFPVYLPKLTTARLLLGRHLEIRGLVKKAFLRALAEHTTNPQEQRRLKELCSREGATEYDNFFIKTGLCILDILNAFESCRPPLSVLLEHLPRLNPRVYSIASSPLADRDTIRIVFNLVTTNSQRKGVCSSWLFKQSGLDIVHKMETMRLEKSSEQSTIPVYFRQATKFRIPLEDASMIMIGPGTGVSPFIGFLEHRRCQYSNSPKSENIQNMLFFGCRHKNRDDIYSNTLAEFEQENILNKLFVCYSRDSSSDFKYVQDLIYSNKQLICDLLTRDETYLFVCGDALNMAKDVHTVLVKSLTETKDISTEEAASILKQKETTHRYLKDSWR